jgi:hypothetical protein
MEEVYNTLTLTGAKWWDLQHSPNEETFKATQFWLDQTSKAVGVEIQTVQPAQRDAWLKRRTDDKGRTLIARYVWLSATGPNKNEINLTKAVQNTLCEQFGLRTAYKYFHTFVSGVASLPRESTPEFERQAFAFCFGPKLAAIWSHRLSKTSTDDITEGIIFTQGDVVQQTYLEFISKIPWNHGICLSSAFLAYLFSMVLCSEIDTLQKNILQGVKEIEGETGFHGFAERKKKLEQGRSLATEAMVEMSAMASGFTTKLAGTGRKTDMIEQLLELMLKRASEDRANRERLASGRTAKEDEPDGGPILEAHVEVMRQRMKMQSSETKYIQERVQIQISAVSDGAVFSSFLCWRLTRSRSDFPHHFAKRHIGQLGGCRGDQPDRLLQLPRRLLNEDPRLRHNGLPSRKLHLRAILDASIQLGSGRRIQCRSESSLRIVLGHHDPAYPDSLPALLRMDWETETGRGQEEEG